MSRLTLNTTNLSVSNATRFEQEIENGDRVFYVGVGYSDNTELDSNTGTDYAKEQNNLFRDTSIFKRMSSQNSTVVIKNIEWNDRYPLDVWTSESVPSGNYYCIADQRVYLVVQNDMFNRTTQRQLGMTPSNIPTHTQGWQRYDDYAYLYVCSIDPIKKAVINNDDWIPIPDITVARSEGCLLYQSIDIDALSGVYINKKNPDIPIKSDTGSNAEIRIRTAPASSPDTTASQRRYKIIGLEVNDIGGAYEDFNLTNSLSSILTNETTETLAALESAITLGFSPRDGFNSREVLQATHVIVTADITSDEIKALSSQTNFNRLSLVENLSAEEGNLSTGDEATFLNSIVVEADAVASLMSSAEAAALLAGKKSIENTSRLTTDNIITSSKVSSGSYQVELEINSRNRKEFAVGDTFNVVGTTQKYEAKSVTLPTIKRSGTTSLHTKKIDFTVSDSNDAVNNRKEMIQSIVRF